MHEAMYPDMPAVRYKGWAAGGRVERLGKHFVSISWPLSALITMIDVASDVP